MKGGDLVWLDIPQALHAPEFGVHNENLGVLCNVIIGAYDAITKHSESWSESSDVFGGLDNVP